MIALESGAVLDVTLSECDACGDWSVLAETCREGVAGECVSCGHVQACACCEVVGHTEAQCPELHDAREPDDTDAVTALGRTSAWSER